ncbi:Dna2/Cas4 domain-containing protein [Vibrio metschnikovii]|nr:Dna2/Cas4 domain-containing protein [Vibrio metschnikovii]
MQFNFWEINPLSPDIMYVLLISSIVISTMLIIFYSIRTIVSTIFDKLVTYPKTQFGFSGKLVYVDDSPSSKVFASRKYQIASKPDFIYQIGFNKYALVEYKSRQGGVKTSDEQQAFAAVIAARSEFNIVKMYIITKGESKEYTCRSTANLYRKIKKNHKRARELKNLRKKAKPVKEDKCRNCGYNYHCFPKG